MFFILPVGVDYRAQRWPVVTFTLMGICTGIHLLSMVLWFNSQAAYGWWMNTFWLTPARSVWFTYLTSMFVHADIFHLLGNMVYLFLFGACVEDLIGRGRFTAFFLVGGVAAAFGQVALTPEHFASAIPMGGASGAISACMGAFALLLWRTQIEFKYFFILVFRFWSGEIHLPAWLVMSFWFGSDVLWAFIDYETKGMLGGGVAFGAHTGGFLLGLGTMALLKPKLHAEETAEEELRETIEQLAARPRPADVPAEEPQFFVSQNGHQIGPLKLDQIFARASAGQITHDALYWQEGMPEWRSIQEII